MAMGSGFRYGGGIEKSKCRSTPKKYICVETFKINI